MEVPKNLRKVKPYEVVVFENSFSATKDGPKMNAVCMDESGNLVVFNTNSYWTNGEVKFYGE